MHADNNGETIRDNNYFGDSLREDVYQKEMILSSIMDIVTPNGFF